MSSFAKPLVALALITSTTAFPGDSAEAGGRGRFYGGLGAGLVAGGIIGAYAYRPYYSGPYYTGPYSYSGPAYYAGPGPYCYIIRARSRHPRGVRRRDAPPRTHGHAPRRTPLVELSNKRVFRKSCG